ncbi:Gfo/Idh/MocA family oxidoreductase [bacterium]|nr:Gfo/Idh/MocA family oxidoreductase [bacterium]
MEIKVGFIGCGGIANAHMMRLSQIEGVVFAGMCDIVEEKAREAAEKYGGNVYTDYREMLEKEKIDCCFICVPPFCHEGQELLCIEKNIPFFVEKPVHLDLQKAEEIAEKVKEKNLITSVGYVLRYFDVVDKLKEILKNEQPAIIRGRYYGQVPGEGKGWYSKKGKSGGQLVEQATHIVDMMRYLVGEIEEIYGYKFEGINREIYEGYNVEDASTLVMKFENGIIGNLTCTWLWKGYESEVEIVGKKIMINYRINQVVVDRICRKETYISEVDPMLEEDRSFIKAVYENNPKLIKSDYCDGVKTLRVTLKAHECFEKGVVVKLK